MNPKVKASSKTNIRSRTPETREFAGELNQEQMSVKSGKRTRYISGGKCLSKNKVNGKLRSSSPDSSLQPSTSGLRNGYSPASLSVVSSDPLSSDPILHLDGDEDGCPHLYNSYQGTTPYYQRAKTRPKRSAVLSQQIQTPPIIKLGPDELERVSKFPSINIGVYGKFHP